MKMKRIIVLWIAVGFAGCGPVKYVKTWKNPEVQRVEWKGKKIAAFVLHPVQKERENVERVLADDLTRRGAIGVPGISIIPVGAERDTAAAKRSLSEAQISGAVVMEITGLDSKFITTGAQAFLVGSPYPTFWGYWDYGWTSLYIPGQVLPKITLVVQTMVYSIAQDKLLWVGASKTTNPDRADIFVRQLADAAAKEIKKAGLLE